MKITIVAGARPNFMKIAPIIRAIQSAQSQGKNIYYRLVHTGQHYDKKMSGSFFDELGIPIPDVNLECGGGTQAEQTASILVKFEKELLGNKPDVVLVVGDVTSTMACTITAKKLCIDVMHVEAGIRSGDMTMPEEINRIVTDAICDHYFTTSVLANKNLLKSSIDESKIHFVGNTMIDTLYQHIGKIHCPEIWNLRKLQAQQYFLLTLHRPSNVDDVNKLKLILDTIIRTTGDHPVIFPVHPRTQKMLTQVGRIDPRLILLEPLGYLEFMFLIKHAKGIITDSGGITEEATVLGVPCLTLRKSTERPETVTMGTNELIGDDLNNLHFYMAKILKGEWKHSIIPPLWDGKTSERIVSIVYHLYEKHLTIAMETDNSKQLNKVASC